MRHRLWQPSKQHNPEFGQSKSKVSLLQQFGRELVHIVWGNEGTRGHLVAGGGVVHDLTGSNGAASGGGGGLTEATVLFGGL